MSSILRALRKLEDEKASLGTGNVDLAHDILKRNYQQRSGLSRSIVGIGCTVLAATIAVTLWVYWPPSGSQPVGITAQQGIEQPISDRPSAPPSELTDSGTSVVENLSPVQPLYQTVTVPEQPRVAENDRLPADLPLLDSGSRGALPQAVSAEAIPQKRVVKATPVAVEAIDIPDLEVEEIVYHQLATSRLAVINDLPVMEGTDIDGARVEEILVDRVRFSFQGIHFNKFLPTSGD